MSTLSDIYLIDRIKQKHDSEAVLELVNRHTGVYINTIKSYSVYPDFIKRANLADLREERTVNIYQWALSYDPNRGMKFGSYVGDMTKHMCQNIIYRVKESTEFDETQIGSNEVGTGEHAARELAVEEIEHEVAESESDIFKRIFGLRHGAQCLSWRKIAAIVGMTHEGARKVYMKHIGAVKEHVAA